MVWLRIPGFRFIPSFELKLPCSCFASFVSLTANKVGKIRAVAGVGIINRASSFNIIIISSSDALACARPQKG